MSSRGMDRPDKVEGAPFYRPGEASGSLLAWIKYANKLEADLTALRGMLQTAWNMSDEEFEDWMETDGGRHERSN